MANELASTSNVKIDGVETTDGRMKVDIGGAEINATIGDISLKNVDVTADKRLKVDTSSAEEIFVFADTITTAGSEIYSGAGKKDITITLSGPGVATFTATLISFGVELPVQGFRETGKPALLDSFSTNQIVTIEKPAGCGLKLYWTLPTGGNVSAKAVIVSA